MHHEESWEAEQQRGLCIYDFLSSLGWKVMLTPTMKLFYGGRI